ncbi:MAG: Protein of unknown function (DUF2442) [Candidatus Electronema aureum]|uniref:DUF2442 domain-containing protein n=1 Tax=Candidatus Electronema aureum TaxID=2005002 RepID=A0A521G1Q9_9BACT|nr:MAG: Protein of unknown function (DUF2442) [Candidatus Electronema aureum]
MRIQEVHPNTDHTLLVIAEDGRIGLFDVTPYLNDEAFAELQNQAAFMQVSNGKYFIEWDCGADLSADTIEARWQLQAAACSEQYRGTSCTT